MIIYEYVLVTQPEVLAALLRAGFLTKLPKGREVQGNMQGEELPHWEVEALMRHDHWRRSRGALRQISGRRVIGS